MRPQSPACLPCCYYSQHYRLEHMKGLVMETGPIMWTEHFCFQIWSQGPCDQSHKFKPVRIFGTNPCDLLPKTLGVNCWWDKSMQPVHSCKLFKGLIAGTSPFMCADLNMAKYFCGLLVTINSGFHCSYLIIIWNSVIQYKVHKLCTCIIISIISIFYLCIIHLSSLKLLMRFDHFLVLHVLQSKLVKQSKLTT